MNINLINYHKDKRTGLLYINISGELTNLDNIYIEDNPKELPSNYFRCINNIYYVEDNKLLCDKSEIKINGLYFIEPINDSDEEKINLYRINNDDSELIANIDCDSNYILDPLYDHKMYKAGKCINELYYCYQCGNYLWK